MPQRQANLRQPIRVADNIGLLMDRKTVCHAAVAKFEALANAAEPGGVRDSLWLTAEHWRSKLELAQWQERTRHRI